MKIAFVVSLALVIASHQGQAFDKTVSNQGLTFHVQTRGDTLTITPSGLKGDNSPITMKIHGKVVDAVADDLNVDHSGEVYVFIQEPGKEKRLTLVAYGANNKKSLTPISMPDLADIPGAARDYAGHDELSIVEGTFVRRFPIPGGKIRQIQFKLRKGEATWVLKVDKVLEY